MSLKRRAYVFANVVRVPLRNGCSFSLDSTWGGHLNMHHTFKNCEETCEQRDLGCEELAHKECQDISKIGHRHYSRIRQGMCTLVIGYRLGERLTRSK